MKLLSQSDLIALASLAATMVAIIVTIVIYLKQRSRLEVGYGVVTDASVLKVKVDEQVKKGVEVLFNGKTVTDLTQIVMRVMNTGNKAIQNTDYKRPITFSFGRDSQVLNLQLIEKKPAVIEPFFVQSDREISLQPDLLNPNDFIGFSVLVTGYAGKVTGDVRIPGGRLVQGVGSSRILSRIDAVAAALAGLGLLLFIAGFIIVLPYAQYGEQAIQAREQNLPLDMPPKLNALSNGLLSAALILLGIALSWLVISVLRHRRRWGVNSDKKRKIEI